MRSELADLLSQLEESKFLQLFRFLSNLQNRQPSIVQPLDLPNSELHLQAVAGSRFHDAAGWFFQLAHLPISLWHPDNTKVFLERNLSAAFNDLKSRNDLLGVLQGERSFDITSQHGWPTHWCNYSPTYYLFTNICDDAITGVGYEEVARDLFRQIIGADPPEHLGFGVGNPESVVAYDSSQVMNFIVELLNMPSAYYFIAREGHVSIVPVTERGSFFASGFPKSRSADPSSAVVTTALSRTNPVAYSVIREFEDLLNRKATKEADIQSFLGDNPEILLALDERYCEIKPHICLYDARKERLVPDFMIRLQDSNIWHAIELKLPKHAVTVRCGNGVRLSARAARGIAELLTYRDFFGQHSNRMRVSDRFGTAPYEPCLVLVIGRGRSTQKYEWESVKGGFPRIEIVSYDYLFERALKCRTPLDSGKEQRITPISPST